VFGAIEAVGQLDIDLFSGDPTSSSSCINLNVPDEVEMDEPLMFEGSASSGTVNALVFEAGTDTEVFAMSQCHLHGINESYDLELSHGTYEMTIIDWTDDPGCDSLLVEHTITTAELITELDLSSIPDLAVSNETDFELLAWVLDGTGHVVSADWADGTTSGVTCVDAKVNLVIYNYTYETPGTYTVLTSASNLLSTKVAENQTISVYERIHDLTIYGNSSTNAPPGTGTWGVAAGPDQLPLENIVCVWNMGTNYEDTVNNVAMLNSSTPHKVAFSYVQADVGTQTINVNCSNAVSSQNLTTDVTVIWDNVTLGELNCTGSTVWDYPITCELTIVRFGTGACFEWDMGDGNPLVYYQDEYCAATVAAASPTYVQVVLANTFRCNS